MTDSSRPRVLAATGRTLAFVAAFVAIVALSAPAGAQQMPGQFPPSQDGPQFDLPTQPEPEEKAERHGDWEKKCQMRPDNERRCFLTQVVIHEQNEKRVGILHIAVGYVGEKKELAAILRVPLALGAYLPTGMTFNVPGVEAMRVVFENCLPRGCSGATKLSDDVVAAMKRALKGTVEINNIRRQKLRLPVSFKGFTAGFAALEKE